MSISDEEFEAEVRRSDARLAELDLVGDLFATASAASDAGTALLCRAEWAQLFGAAMVVGACWCFGSVLCWFLVAASFGCLRSSRRYLRLADEQSRRAAEIVDAATPLLDHVREETRVDRS